MKVLAVLALFLALFALFGIFSDASRNSASAQEQSIALNYVLYRQAVFAYVFDPTRDHKKAGSLSPADLRDYLPEAWLPLAAHPWQTRLVEVPNAPLQCVIWGDASPSSIAWAHRLLKDSFAIGRAENRRLVPHHGGSARLPDFVPENSIVSVFYVD